MMHAKIIDWPRLTLGAAAAMILTLLSVTIAAPSVDADDNDFVGVVKKITPRRDSSATLERNGSSRSARIFDKIYEGDRIAIANKGEVVEVSIFGGGSVKISYPGGLVGAEVEREGSFAMRIVSSIIDDFAKEEDTGTVALRTRSGTGAKGSKTAFRIAGLQAGTAQLVAGERPLFLIWQSKNDIRSIAIEGPDGAIYRDTRVSPRARTITVPVQNWKAGETYTVNLRMSDYSNLTGRFKAVKQGPKTELGTASVFGDPALDTALAAMEVARRNAPRWSLEAHQKLKDLPPEYADIVSDSLAALKD